MHLEKRKGENLGRNLSMGPCTPFALTQSAFMLTYALLSRASSVERSPTCSTLTILPLRPLVLIVRNPLGGGEMFKAGNLIERLMRSNGIWQEIEVAGKA
jgi:hypothetical protein